MKVHPLPKKRNNVTIRFYDHRGDPLVSSSGGSQHKKLRRLPHIFSRVLELPFRSDAEVSVEENPDCFRFVAETDNNIGEVRAHTVEIYPGVTKIVIRPNGYLELSPLDDLELDMWRFRLPETTRPELASAVLADGELIVTVPKVEEVEEEGNGNNNNGEFRGGTHCCTASSLSSVLEREVNGSFHWSLLMVHRRMPFCLPRISRQQLARLVVSPSLFVQ
ncbi:hypothetical protein SADUNF_Sadunf10G0053900 [Salix dunnii]|uniref:SHSP domain-containing protein n=1 Tax=Salix dunnii TaxID=1413687 RepID=A0A835JSI3_9ROSI|nr:hypothetical protein SADUNF_Sadunf10G0053900 [Salix dunnii]